MPVTISKTGYTFAGLDERAQERAIEWQQQRAANWIETDELEDHDYWLEEWLTPLGFTSEERRVTLYGGGTLYEPAIYWTTYPHRAYFDATIDLETFILARKLGNTYRALLNAARAGYIYASIEESDRSGPSVDVELGPNYEWTDEQEERIAAQADAIQEEILDAYRDICARIGENIRAQEEWLTSEEVAREWLENNGDDLLFDDDGSPMR